MFHGEAADAFRLVLPLAAVVVLVVVMLVFRWVVHGDRVQRPSPRHAQHVDASVVAREHDRRLVQREGQWERPARCRVLGYGTEELRWEIVWL